MFDELKPEDGFRVQKFELGQMEISICLGLKQHGEWVRCETRAPTVEIWSASTPSPVDYGRRTRAFVLSEALCRYFNTGGSWEELQLLLNAMREVITGGIVYPGFHLFDTYSDTNGVFTSVWAGDTSNQVVRWVEDEFIDTSLTLEDLQRELDEDDESTVEFGEPADSFATLSSDEDNAIATEDAGGSTELPGADSTG